MLVTVAGGSAAGAMTALLLARTVHDVTAQEALLPTER